MTLKMIYKYGQEKKITTSTGISEMILFKNISFPFEFLHNIKFKVIEVNYILL